MRRQRGVVPAVVKKLEDGGGEGRVIVEYPWLPGKPLSPPAAIAVMLAGGGRGSWLMPEVGDEVLVAFEHGSFDHPYVVGFLWNGVDKPPETDPAHRVIVTPGGHELRFEDTENDKRVVIKTEAGHSVTLDDKAQTLTLKTAGKATSPSATITLSDADGSIELRGGGRALALKGNQVKIT